MNFVIDLVKKIGKVLNKAATVYIQHEGNVYYVSDGFFLAVIPEALYVDLCATFNVYKAGIEKRVNHDANLKNIDESVFKTEKNACEDTRFIMETENGSYRLFDCAGTFIAVNVKYADLLVGVKVAEPKQNGAIISFPVEGMKVIVLPCNYKWNGYVIVKKGAEENG